MIQAPFPRSAAKHPLISIWASRIKNAFVNALDLLWRFIGWVWSFVILTIILPGVLGNEASAYFTHGQFDPIDLSHLPAILWVETHIAITLLLFCCLVSLTIGAFVVHRNKQKSKALAPLKSSHTLQHVKFLDPNNFKLVHYVQRAYIARDADKQAHQILHDLATNQNTLDKTTLGICIVGRPAQGKTRLAWEAMQEELADWTLMRWVHEQTNLSDIMAYQTKNIILWLDDLHEYANLSESVVLNDLPRRFLEKENRLIIIATCRDGDNYTQTKKYFESLLERLVTITLPNIDAKDAIELAKILVEEGKGEDVHAKEFDGTPGSLILGLGRMHGRYLHLPKPAQTLLKTMKLLYSAQIYTYPEKRLTAVAHDLFSFQPSDWQEATESLEQEGFVAISVSPEGELLLEQVADSYLEEKVIQDYPTTHMSLTDDWIRLKHSFEKAHDASGLINLGNAFNEQAKKTSKVQHEYGIQCYRAALMVYTREQAPLDWAMVQNNLGTALLDLAARLEGDESIQQLKAAISAYRASLEVRTREQAPLNWAGTLNNLGAALSDLAARLEGDESIQQLKAAISAYRTALEVQTRKQTPFQWAITQNNLGAALNNLATKLEGDESIQQFHVAISAFRDALEVRTREQTPFQWAITQNNLGNVLRDLATRLEGEESLQQLHAAISAYRAALEVQTREQAPLDWAMAQTNLGIALRDLATRLEGEESLQQLHAAISAYRAALLVYTREQAPFQWATTQNNLGNALRDLTTRLEGEKSIQQFHAAISAYRAALEVQTRKQAPLDWAMAQNNLGVTLSDLAARLEGDESIQQLQAAISAYKASLEVRTREQAPLDWAGTQGNLGTALSDLAATLKGDKSIQQFHAAISTYKAALEVQTREQAPLDWAMTQNNVGNALRDLAARLEGDESIQQLYAAISSYKAALLVYTREQTPFQWATTQNNLGTAWRYLATTLEGKESLQQLHAAISAYRAALEIQTRKQAPFQWASLHIQIAFVHFSMVDKIEEKEICPQLQIAFHCVKQALSIYSATSYPDAFAQLRDFSQEILQAMQKYHCHPDSNIESYLGTTPLE